MAGTKQIWVLAGGNGAGKSTFFNQYLSQHGIRFVNSDLIARELDPDNPEQASYEAATLAGQIREDLIRQGISFCFETVFSHKSKIDFLAQAKAYGYSIILIYIHLFAPCLNEARVHQRVTQGGHFVPAEKILSRIPRAMENVKTALPLADEAWLMDNSSGKDRFRLVLRIRSGICVKKVEPLPDWAAYLLSAQ
ncbi:MAG: zeta toxin family protein [Desulfatibacillaceae bacterium]|nr:zeta toxin family protein [Desulfatibacillaceae bacterium]